MSTGAGGGPQPILKARPPKHKSNSACCLPQSACSSPNLRSARHFPEPDRRLGTMRASDEQAAAGWWRPASGSLRSASDDLDSKSVVSGKRVSVRGNLGGGRSIKKKKT